MRLVLAAARSLEIFEEPESYAVYVLKKAGVAVTDLGTEGYSQNHQNDNADDRDDDAGEQRRRKNAERHQDHHAAAQRVDRGQARGPRAGIGSHRGARGSRICIASPA